ncbi:tumor necrosis factor receptor superfamily member 18 isoform X2 [Mastacembelus armatus]|uniref:tumor necrosis factor receptor superfamily member 18 isoform X2 n=1 Tax=Mastacembelus armatus TaxID=205130 RepID=UPI000E456CFE|nr:tumor necrosis factor receptor superfamily member 11B-like isoform X2 [Mastacembelus armatus]
MIPLTFSLAVIFLLNIWTSGYATSCGANQTDINGLCCDLCPPGTYMKDFCTVNNPTVCSPCNEGYFSDKFIIFDRCQECQICQQEYAEKCTPTMNAKCSCRSGFLCSDNICSTCEENKCVTGEKVNKTAIPTGGGLVKYSYQCEPACADNTYFDVKEDKCKAFTQCSAFRLQERFPGNKTHNSVCSVYGMQDSDSLQVIFGIGFVLLCFSLLVFVFHACTKNLRKHKANKNPILPVSTNISDFHLSKEESGIQLVIQDESKDCNTSGELYLGKETTH